MPMAVPALVVVLLCILAAGAVVTAVAAFSKSIFSREDQDASNVYQRSPQQDSYQRRIREINQDAVWDMTRTLGKNDKRQRHRDASDIEVQSGTSHSNAAYGGYSPNFQRAYSGGGGERERYDNGVPLPPPRNRSVPYEDYTTEYHLRSSQEEPQRPYGGPHGNVYVPGKPKGSPIETWSEVPSR